MKTAKAKLPVGLKILIIISVVLLCILLYGLVTYEVYHFPSDSLSNYPGTQWKCDKLGLELFVDEAGAVSGSYKDGSETISLDDVIARASTTFHSNYIQFFVQDKTVFLHCFYTKIDDGVFYVIIDADESTLDLNVIPEIVPYKFEKQAG